MSHTEGTQFDQAVTTGTGRQISAEKTLKKFRHSAGRDFDVRRNCLREVAGVTKLHKPHYQNKYHGMHLFIAIITIGETALLLSDAAQVRRAQRHGSAVPRPVGNI
jgi:hypothetical protein